MVYWPVSGDFVFITILSGTGNVGATFIGALVYELLRTYAFEFAPEIWQLILGGSLLLIIMFLPDGLWSIRSELRNRRELRQAKRDSDNRAAEVRAMTRVLEVHDLEKNFGGVVAAHNINVTVDIGETIGIIGANGAGKTTFVNMVTGYLNRPAGEIEFMGKSVVGLTAARCHEAWALPVVPGAPGFLVGDLIFDNMLVAYGIAERSGSACLRRFIRMRRRAKGRCATESATRFRTTETWLRLPYRRASANCLISPWRLCAIQNW